MKILKRYTQLDGIITVLRDQTKQFVHFVLFTYLPINNILFLLEIKCHFVRLILAK